MDHLWAHMLHSLAEVRMLHSEYILSFISGADRHLCGRGHGPDRNTSQDVAIQERFLSSVEYPLQQIVRTNLNADRRAISTNVAPNANSTQPLP